MRIVIDAMGTDERPGPDVAGGVLAAQEWGEDIILVGDEVAIRRELAKHQTAGLKIHVQPAAEVITMEDKPSKVWRNKPNSSIHVGMRLVADGQADGFVSAGNTGALLATAMLATLKRIEGINRPALAVTFPVPGLPLSIDNGANADCKPEWLLQFAIMGSIYAERVRGIKNPRICLISNGEEEGKGNTLVKSTAPILAASNLNFIGNLEPYPFLSGGADVAVTDGFTGNIMIKSAEAVAKIMMKTLRDAIMSSSSAKLGGMLVKPVFDQIRADMSPDAVGGAPLLGVNGVVIVSHGGSSPYAIKQAVGQARLAVQNEVVGAIRAGINS